MTGVRLEKMVHHCVLVRLPLPRERRKMKYNFDLLDLVLARRWVASHWISPVALPLLVMATANHVVQALKILQEEEREDLLQEGVLEHTWVGLKHRKRVSSEGVAMAVLACTSPDVRPKKYKQKSTTGRRSSSLPHSAAAFSAMEKSELSVPYNSGPVLHRGSAHLEHHSGTLFRDSDLLQG
ncbi:hypothetical protein NDU88_004551 [Pleurodeles waltl]|uniref:Uncharacterized protein n=1 Tax=Pleurodeles waltl TaxID=8319 RepID=A0AAV7NLD1_PLEWA|nr:hypothetical protein NDU88_004551 [Pleurodeles waltl]